MLLASVHVGKMTPDGSTEHIDVPHLSIWYALPTTTHFAREIDGTKLHASQAVIQTPKGEVHIWPHEYTVVKDLSKYLEFTEEQGFNIHFLNPESGGFDEQKLHYIRTRGISLAEARRWLLPELKNPYFCYFTFNEEYSKAFGEYFGSVQGLRVKMSQSRRQHSV